MFFYGGRGLQGKIIILFYLIIGVSLIIVVRVINKIK